MTETCQFMAPYAGRMLACNQPRRWRGARWGATEPIEVCDGHKHLLSDPKEIS